MDKPLLIFDGDCGFCRTWILRWKNLTGDHVEYAPSQEVAKNFPDIPPGDFHTSVQLIEPGGRRSSGAKAVFRTLHYAGRTQWIWAYERMPGFSALSEFAYGIVAGHRPAFTAVTRWLISEPASYRKIRWIFLRALAVIYGVAFWSFGMQVRGLIGSQGIMPVQSYLPHLVRYGFVRFWSMPTLAWINASDPFLVGLCMAGVLCSLLVFFNLAPRISLFLSWLLYLSLVTIGGDFMNFQWDALLLETGFLGIFLAPGGLLPERRGARSPSFLFIFLLRWLLFRLMIQSAIVKWSSGDPLWRQLTALTVHYQTQPLPNPLSWTVHQLPVWFHQVSCVGMFVIEGLVPFLIFAPRRLRRWAFGPLLGLQVLILLSGNYAFFNGLTILLCVMLLEDRDLRAWMPFRMAEPRLEEKGSSSRLLRWTPGLAGILIVFLTAIPFANVLGVRLPKALRAPAVWVSPLRSFNSYGLFAVMTPIRPEIILEGSNDGRVWKAYEFKYKPGDVNRRPTQIAPFQPRLDWQMWFAALSDYHENAWFLNCCLRVLQGSKPVLALFAENPFPGAPPSQLRAVVYEYRFTTRAERRQTGNWWVRENKGLYCPLLSLKERHSEGV